VVALTRPHSQAAVEAQARAQSRSSEATSGTAASQSGGSAPSTDASAGSDQATGPQASGTAAGAASQTGASQSDTAALLAAEQSAKEAAAVPYPNPPAVRARRITNLQPKHKYIALTIDDGYNFQPAFLDLLERYNVRCTTFLLGDWMQNHKDIVKRLDDDGFEVANHTWDHKNLAKLTAPQISAELNRSQKLITSITGDMMPYMRPPGGASDPLVKTTAAKEGYTIVLWNRTTADSGSSKAWRACYRHVMTDNGGPKPGDIILCHWGSTGAYHAMARIIPELQAQGFEFVTISELIADSQR
jgi:peptidoglycan-N-acetylglucosamine deacetylase